MASFSRQIVKLNQCFTQNYYLNSKCFITFVPLCQKIEAPPEDTQATLTDNYLRHYKSRKGIPASVLKFIPHDMKFLDYLNGKFFQEFAHKWKNADTMLLLHDQRYIDKRVDMLGFDLAAAHFIVARGGMVKFRGHATWVKRNKKGEFDLPGIFQPRYFIEHLDVSGLPLIYEGLVNLDDLAHVKTLNLSRCPNIDDWCLDRISAQFFHTLEEIDISHCPKITDKGVETLGKFRNLKKLKVEGLDHVPNLKLICLLLEEQFEGLITEGISFH